MKGSQDVNTEVSMVKLEEHKERKKEREEEQKVNDMDKVKHQQKEERKR